jgi:hypothetical protein
MLNSEIEFKENGEFIEMWWEQDAPPFDDRLMGCIRKGDDGYRFHPARKAVLTVKHLRFLIKKCSGLNYKEFITDSRADFEKFWRAEMNIKAMPLTRKRFPMTAYCDQPYCCQETDRSWISWQASRK